MNEVSTPVEDAVADTVKTVTAAAEPVQKAVADVVQKTVIAPAVKAAKPVRKASAAKPVAAAKSAVAKVTAAAPAPKRAYKKRVSKVTAPMAAVAKGQRKVAAKITPRQYTRKTAAVVTATTAPLIEGYKSMSYEMPNWFSAFTSVPGADKFQDMFAGVGEKGQEVVKKGQAFAEQMSDSAKANMEAVVESSRIAAAGARDLGQEMLASSKSGVEHASAAVKSLSEAKSPTEFFQIQSDLAKTSFDRMVAESSKFTEQFVKFAGEAVQPLSNRASITVEKIKELTA